MVVEIDFPDLEAGLLFQERQEGYLSNDDDSQSLRLALQRQDHPLYGQVSLNLLVCVVSV